MTTLTGPMPLLPRPRLGLDAGRANLRAEALHYLGADGTALTNWTHFTIVIGEGGLWIAQDDELPRYKQDDPIAREWREIVRYLWGRGYYDLPDPMFDTKTGVWVWVVLW